MASEQEEQFWKKQRENQKQSEKLLKPLREARIAIELSLLMEDALKSMNADMAARLESIAADYSMTKSMCPTTRLVFQKL